MTVSSETRKAGPYNGDGINKNFPFAFLAFQTSDLLVIQQLNNLETTLVLGTHYTVSLNADQEANPGGSVTMVTAPEATETITLTTDVPYTQTVKLTNAGGFYPTVINSLADKLTVLIQQVQEAVSRAIKLPISSTVTADEIIQQLLSVKAYALQALASALAAAASAASVDLHVVDLQNQTKTAFTTTGSGGVYEVTTSPSYEAMNVGERMRVRFHEGNAAPCLLNRDGRGSFPIMRYDAIGGLIEADIFQFEMVDVEYDGQYFIMLGAPAPAVTNRRHTVLYAHVSSDGDPDILPNGSANLSLNTLNVNTTNPLIVACANAFDTRGIKDRLGFANSTLTWASLTANTTLYLYVIVNDDGTLTTGFTNLRPNYQYGGILSVTNNQFTFDIARMKMFKGDGSSSSAVHAVFIGECVTDGTTVTDTTIYAYRGEYLPAWTNTLPGPVANIEKPANLGLIDGVEVHFEMLCISAQHGYAVGDVVTNPATYNLTHLMPISIGKTYNKAWFTTGSQTAFYVVDKSTGAFSVATAGSWKWRLTARRSW